MCGFFGVDNLHDCIGDQDIDDVKNATNKIIYRGPDDGQVVSGDTFCFGFRRLSIIDLLAASQPYLSADKSIIMMCNGEIYNYKSLKKQLIRKGYQFKTNTDVEVVLHGYAEWKQSLWDKLNGIYSIVVYDRNQRRLYLVRDRLGVKPLHVLHFNNKIYFASDYSSFSSIEGLRLELDKESMLSYLSFRYVIGKKTFYKDVRDVLPGSCVVCDTTSNSSNLYWDVPTGPAKSISLDSAIEQLDFHLDKSVRSQLISDVPLGAYISGGLDSSLLLSYIVKYKPDIKTYISGFEDDLYNEFKYADIVADHLNVSIDKLLINQNDYIDNMERAILYRGEPLSVPHESAFLSMTENLSRHVKVVMSGEGADELFAGYGRIFRSPHDFFMGKIPLLRSLINCSAMQGGFDASMQPIDHFLQRYSWFTGEDKARILNKEYFDRMVFDEYSLSYIEHLFDNVSHLSYYQGIYYLLAKLHLPNLLNRLDRMTMGASVEARVPFLDHTLVEFASGVPHGYKLRWKNHLSKFMSIFHDSEYISERYDIPKYILKQVARDRIPSSIIDRKKMGFPVYKWVDGKLGGIASEIVTSNDSIIRDLFNIDEVLKLFDQSTVSDQYDMLGKKIWMLVNIELWAKQMVK